MMLTQACRQLASAAENLEAAGEYELAERVRGMESALRARLRLPEEGRRALRAIDVIQWPTPLRPLPGRVV